jgi:hypothetical protein
MLNGALLLSLTNCGLQQMMAFLGIYVVLSIMSVLSYTMAWKSTWPFEMPSIPEILTKNIKVLQHE